MENFTNNKKSIMCKWANVNKEYWIRVKFPNPFFLCLK